MNNQAIQAVPNNLAELVRSINIQVSGDSAFRRFQRMYKNDRIAFVYDCFPVFSKTIADYQVEILGIFDSGHSRVAVRGPHGLGKTFLASLITHHSALTSEEDAKVITTASAWRQLEYYLWPEIRKAAKFINWQEVGRIPYDPRTELLSLSIRLNQGTVEAFAVASDDETTIEGAHATRLVYIFDEAKTIPRKTWDAAEGAFANAGLKTALIAKTSNVMDGIYNKDTPTESLYSDSNSANLLSSNNNSIGHDIAKEELIRNDVEAIVMNDARSIELCNSNKDIELSSELEKGAIARDNSMNLDAQSLDAQSSTIQSLERQKFSIECYEALAFAISTPGEPSGQFYDIHMQKPGFEDWYIRHVTLEESIRAGRISKDWADQREKQWGKDSSIYMNRVQGEFADSTEEGIIPLSWIRYACTRWQTWNKEGRKEIDGKKTLGVDVARGGEDKTVIAIRMASVISTLQVYSKLSVTSTASKIRLYNHNRYIHIETDGGLGASVYDILKAEGIPMLRPITVSGRTDMRDKSRELGFANVRSAMWWNLRELLDPASDSEPICLPPIEGLILDLCTPTFEIIKGGIVQLEGKDSIASRIGRSTDYGDSVCLAFWMQSSGGGLVF